MPSTSQAQRRAMEAAKAGRSTLGIPKKVGQEYVRADRAKARAAKKKGRKRKLPARSKAVLVRKRRTRKPTRNK